MKRIQLLSFALFSCTLVKMSDCKAVPLVINTWAFTNATATGWDAIREGKSALDAIEAGCSRCEFEQCDHTVGYGGSPDETGETTLDAMIMDGVTHDVGAVGGLRRIKSAISVARKVLHHTEHTLLIGEQATMFAVKMGFKEESLSSNYSNDLWKKWKSNACQPNFWKNVTPDSKKYCGPYKPIASKPLHSKYNDSSNLHDIGPKNHDTIGMIAIDKNGNIAAGTSSNGAKFKIPGRVGDSPIPGAGAYVDQDVGGAAATGDGDIMMRFLPSYSAVESLRLGFSAMKAAEYSILRISKKYPNFIGAVIATTISGEFGAACHGMKEFPFSIANEQIGKVIVKTVPCVTLP